MTERTATKTDLLDLDAIRQGGKRALARALGALETQDGSAEIAALLDTAELAATAHVVGMTGPPGVGKSTLTNALLRHWRASGLTVGVIAVDPSSRFSRGALLGDRTRLDTDPTDQGIFVRSMAARDRLGGLSNEAVSAIVLMRAVFDRVLVESVGIGQSEADIAFAADTIVLCIQPGSGDSLQFMKAGVMELPDVVVVTKADMGALAQRARADVQGALSLGTGRTDRGATAYGDAPHPQWTPPVLCVSALQDEGISELIAAIDWHDAHLRQTGQLARGREQQRLIWLEDRLRGKFGRIGLEHASVQEILQDGHGPFEAERLITQSLTRKLALKS